MPSYELSGKAALVTGAARGIGFETAKALHARGASVAIVDLEEDAAQRAADTIGGERTLGLGADVSDRDAIAAAVAAAVERFGGLDVCVANAGIAPAAATVRTMDPEVFERVLEVDLLGVYRTVHAALPHVVERRGQLVLVASVAAFVNGMLLAPYGMAKAGVEQLGRALRTELARHGASASVAYFGFIDTEMVRQGYEQDPLAVRAEAQVPRLIRRRLAPSKAAAAIVRGLERRAPRIIAPRYWTAASLLRGLINPPFDRASERRAQIQALIAEADVEDRFAGPKLTVPAGRERI